jgi:hypothetical protein
MAKKEIKKKQKKGGFENETNHENNEENENNDFWNIPEEKQSTESNGKRKSKAPYILIIHKAQKKEEMILLNNTKELLSYTKEFSPSSGSEQEYEPDKWNSDFSIKMGHNCYSYALGNIVPKLNSKAQPGYSSGYKHIYDKDYKCKNFYRRLKKDSPGSYIEKFDNKCLPGFYKIFLALDPKQDYHWYRMHPDGYWSHKPGSTNVIDVDASGNKIKNPLIADRKYDSLNYFKPCFFACVYSDLTRSLANIYNLNT